MENQSWSYLVCLHLTQSEASFCDVSPILLLKFGKVLLVRTVARFLKHMDGVLTCLRLETAATADLYELFVWSLGFIHFQRELTTMSQYRK